MFPTKPLKTPPFHLEIRGLQEFVTERQTEASFEFEDILIGIAIDAREKAISIDIGGYNIDYNESMYDRDPMLYQMTQLCNHTRAIKRMKDRMETARQQVIDMKMREMLLEEQDVERFLGVHGRTEKQTWT